MTEMAAYESKRLLYYKLTVFFPSTPFHHCSKKGGGGGFQGLMTRGERQRGDWLLNVMQSRASCLFCPPKLFHHNVHSPVLLSPLSPPASPKRTSLTSELSYSNPSSFKINQQAPIFSLVFLICFSLFLLTTSVAGAHLHSKR